MAPSDKPQEDPVLDEATLMHISQALKPRALSARQAADMRARIAHRARADLTPDVRDTQTIRARQGLWIEIAPRVETKLLHTDRKAGTRSFLMRLQPGGVWHAHEHHRAEECIVLEGEAAIGNVRVSQGDFHLAPKGVAHGDTWSESGALLFIRAGLEDATLGPLAATAAAMRTLKNHLRPRR